MSGLRVRREEVPDDALVVVRGGLLEPVRLTRDATRTFRRFGVYGISVLAAEDETALDVIAGTTLQREPVLTLMRMGTLRIASPEVRPTFRRPHFTVMLPDLDADIAGWWHATMLFATTLTTCRPRPSDDLRDRHLRRLERPG